MIKSIIIDHRKVAIIIRNHYSASSFGEGLTDVDPGLRLTRPFGLGSGRWQSHGVSHPGDAGMGRLANRVEGPQMLVNASYVG